MKKIILLFALLFTFSSTFISCRDNPKEEEAEVELNDEEANSYDDADAVNEDSVIEVPREKGVGEIEEEQ